MCGICGCSEPDLMHEHNHDHHHTHEHHDHLIQVEQDILAINNQHALHNQHYFEQANILALNLMSSPGSGKTTLLSKTIADLKNNLDMAVLVGDQQTRFDADLIEASGGRALQVNTGKVCHLDAHSVAHALPQLSLKEKSLLFIENVGNLVCPALFNLGEHYKVVILSVTEGDNKPLKYPDMFRCADLMIVTKMDLLPYVDFDLEKSIEYVKRIKPDIDVLTLSTKSNQGLQAWYNWLLAKR